MWTLDKDGTEQRFIDIHHASLSTSTIDFGSRHALPPFHRRRHHWQLLRRSDVTFLFVEGGRNILDRIKFPRCVLLEGKNILKRDKEKEYCGFMRQILVTFVEVCMNRGSNHT